MATRRPVRPTARPLRRSFVLPARLVEEVRESTPPYGPANLNAIVRVALEEYVARRRAEAFAAEMARMARDPAVQAECAALGREFRPTERDGLREGPPGCPPE